MSDFFNKYLNIKKIREEKRKYKEQMARIENLPSDYQYAYKRIQKYMWSFAAGDGYDMLEIQYELLDLFEESALNGKTVLEITGEDVAEFVDELLRNASTYTFNQRERLNKAIAKNVGKKD